MAVCSDCKQEMQEADSCNLKEIEISGKTYSRNTIYFDVNNRCHDCGIINKESNIHHLGCDIERCPKCDGQLIGCGCYKE